MRCLLSLLVLSVVTVFPATAQKERNIWYFGKKAGIDFNSGVPVALTNSAMIASESASSCADSSGKLLFYTDGTTVWNRDHNVMPNGTGLKGHFSSTHGALIVPLPGSPDIYYIFTSGDISAGSIDYSIVDMRSDNGNGDVVSKNVHILNEFSEKLAAIRIPDKSGYWIATCEASQCYLRIYKLTAAGLDTGVYLRTKIPLNSWSTAHGEIRFSPDGTMLAWCNTTVNKVSVCDFDVYTGAVSGYREITVGMLVYGLEFSPNSQFLYLTWGPNLYQAPVPRKSLVISDSGHFIGPGNYQIELGPDRKVYALGRAFSPSARALSVVHKPDLPLKDCDFRYSSLSLAGRESDYGLPAFPQICNALSFSGRCFNDTTEIRFHSEDDSAFVNTGDGNFYRMKGVKGFFYYKHMYAKPGNYIALVTSYGAITNIDSITINIATTKAIFKKDSSFLCSGDSLSAGTSEGYNFLWTTGDTLPFIKIKKEGIYALQFRDINNCLSKDTLNVLMYKTTQFALAPDTSLCPGDSLTIGDSSARNVTWSTGDTLTFITVKNAGTYSVKFKDSNNCQVKDSFRMELRKVEKPALGPDTSFCEKDTFKIVYAGSAVKVRWSTGDSLPSIRVANSGTYTITTTDSFMCVSGDTIQLVRHNMPKKPEIVRNCTLNQPVLSVQTPESKYRWNDQSQAGILYINAAGSYHVTVTNVNGCINADTIEINALFPDTPEIGSDTLACAGNVKFTYQSSKVKNTWPDGSSGSTFVTGREGPVKLIVTDSFGCYASDSLYVTHLKFTYPVFSDTALCRDSLLQVSVSAPGSDVRWSTGDTADVIFARSPGRYEAIFSNRCETVKRDFYISRLECNCPLYLPNAFTPNENGVNETFGPVTECDFSDYRLEIYNRWGQCIFTSTDPSVLWDGIYKSELCPEGVYFCTLSWRGISDRKRRNVTQVVTLLR